MLDDCPRDALIPPLMLQPLLENAVYHGVEPASEPEPIVFEITRVGNEVRVRVENATVDVVSHQRGNRMALANIRERLMLFFDLEARLETDASEGRYRVAIRLPYRRRDWLSSAKLLTGGPICPGCCSPSCV